MTKKIKEIGIFLEKEEIDCIKNIIKIVEGYNELKNIGIGFPESEIILKIKKLREILIQNPERLTSHSRLRKFQNTPSSVYTNLLEFVIKNCNIDDFCGEILWKLNFKIRKLIHV